MPEPCRVLFPRRHAILGGATGSGKSGGLNDLLASLAACQDVIIWAIDLKRGMELQPWAPCIDRLATTPAAAGASGAAGVSGAAEATGAGVLTGIMTTA
jgi:S-DNA-T family DNA segregation ATPase FtsK/SpoIIIE